MPQAKNTQDDTNLPSDILSARTQALYILNCVLNQKQALDHAIESADGFRRLPSRDKAFARMLTATTLRRLGQIDILISHYEDRPGSVAKSPTLNNILRLGISQIFFMDLADHAAVDTSVRLASASGLERQKGMVNGILRNALRSGKELLDKQDTARLNTPEWLLKTWIEDYGLTEAGNIAIANMAEAPLDITLKDPQSASYWGNTLNAASFSTGSLRRASGGAVHEMTGFDDGAWWIQDASAAIPATLFGDITDKTVIDICAAPGGKTAQLATQGAQVLALDRSAKRLKRLQENMERLDLLGNVETLASDASVWKPHQAPDYILLDAPCSATGTIRRHPDVLWLKQACDIERLIDLQWRILNNAFEILAPGGVLIYCTCSLQKSEGEHQIRRLINEQKQALRLPIHANEIGDLEELLNDNGEIRILPHMQAASGGMDGFFVARLAKAVD